MTQLDPNIILSGNALDAIGSLDRGQVAGQRQREIQRSNALSGIFQQHGPGIASGEENALNALARFDPMAAQTARAQTLDQDRVRLGMDATRLNMDQAEQQMKTLTREEQWAIEDRAASMSAAERAAASERLQQAANMVLNAQTPEQFDSIMQSMGLDEYTGQFANREMLAARGLSTADAFKRYDAANAPVDPSKRYDTVGGQLVDLYGEGGPAPVPGIGGQEAPASFQALQMRAEAAGLQPGTPQYQQFMAQGGGAGADPSAPEARIARLMEDGSIDRNTAIGIVDGRLTVTRDPVTGAGQIIDKANGRVVGQASEGVTAQAETSDGSSMPEGTDFATATGIRGFGVQLANTVSDALGGGLVDQNNERATQAMQNLSTNTMIALADGVAGRPSNFLLEQFQNLTTSPNSIWQGEGRTRERLNQTRDMIAEAILLNEDVTRSEVTPQMRAQAQQNISRLQRLKRDYDVVIDSFGSRSGQDDGTSRTGSGVTWRVVE